MGQAHRRGNSPPASEERPRTDAGAHDPLGPATVPGRAARGRRQRADESAAPGEASGAATLARAQESAPAPGVEDAVRDSFWRFG